MSVEKNKAVARRDVEEVFNKGNTTIVDEIIGPDWVFYGPGGLEFKGQEGYKQIVTTMRNAFPDLHMTIEDMIGEGDKIAVRYTMRGTFKGQLMGMAPTGNQFTMTSALFMRFKDGKLVETREIFDQLTFFQQLGVSPPAA